MLPQPRSDKGSFFAGTLNNLAKITSQHKSLSKTTTARSGSSAYSDREVAPRRTWSRPEASPYNDCLLVMLRLSYPRVDELIEREFHREKTIGELKEYILKEFCERLSPNDLDPTKFDAIFRSRIISDDVRLSKLDYTPGDEITILFPIPMERAEVIPEFAPDEIIPTFERGRFRITPPLEELCRMTEAELASVEPFVVENEFARVEFEGSTDLREVNLDEDILVESNPQRPATALIEIYPHGNEPQIGEKLNKNATITFKNVDFGNAVPQDLEGLLERKAQSQQAELHSFNVDTREVTFRITGAGAYDIAIEFTDEDEMEVEEVAKSDGLGIEAGASPRLSAVGKFQMDESPDVEAETRTGPVKRRVISHLGPGIFAGIPSIPEQSEEEALPEQRRPIPAAHLSVRPPLRIPDLFDEAQEIPSPRRQRAAPLKVPPRQSEDFAILEALSLLNEVTSGAPSAFTPGRQTKMVYLPLGGRPSFANGRLVANENCRQVDLARSLVERSASTADERSRFWLRLPATKDLFLSLFDFSVEETSVETTNYENLRFWTLLNTLVGLQQIDLSGIHRLKGLPEQQRLEWIKVQRKKFDQPLDQKDIPAFQQVNFENWVAMQVEEVK
eukprot:TRINITY_DN1956_c0_g1_i6.p1 TRINITY_DN1956_c0_g1~~TRINITY_DN1956_c0_g1_i6.p1  ORF type:complete len:619 (+),score=138.71 TRINITY_DN1956_c0_g1_i6:151-2007(+)